MDDGGEREAGSVFQGRRVAGPDLLWVREKKKSKPKGWPLLPFFEGKKN